jgi:hypothetical protein
MAVGKLWELAARPDMPSIPTLRRLMRDHPAFPVIERGRKGADYLFDLDKAAAFVLAHWGDARRRKPYGVEVGADPQQCLPGFEVAAAAPADNRS